MNDADDDARVPDFKQDMIQAMVRPYAIQYFKNAIQEAPVGVPIDDYHTLAVHSVIMCRPDILQLLLQHEPDIAANRPPRERVLLCEALQMNHLHNRDAFAEMIRLIVDRTPQEVFEQHNTPLNLACEKAVSVEILELLLARCPGAAGVYGGPGDDLPIHWALQHSLPEPFISSLLDAFPGGASVPGNAEELPLHFACHKGYSRDLVMRLVALYRTGLFIRDMSVSYLFIMRVCTRIRPWKSSSFSFRRILGPLERDIIMGTSHCTMLSTDKAHPWN